MNAFKLVPKTCVTYLMHVEDHYRRENPYHNSIHAADVVQSSHVLLSIPFLQVTRAPIILCPCYIGLFEKQGRFRERLYNLSFPFADRLSFGL